jgi:hypothetical protein
MLEYNIKVSCKYMRVKGKYWCMFSVEQESFISGTIDNIFKKIKMVATIYYISVRKHPKVNNKKLHLNDLPV